MAARPWRAVSRADRPAPSGRGDWRSTAALRQSWLALLTLAVSRPDGRDLLGHVDTDRAPRDAPPAADAAGNIELVVPRGELVREPLPVAPAGARPEVAAVDLCELRIEAAIPTSDSLGILQAQVGHILHTRAKTGWADERAIRAREAA